MPHGDHLSDTFPIGPLRPSARSRRPAQRMTRDADPARRVFCPECHRLLAENEQPEHLMAVHGYLPVSGILLSRSATVACLWDRVFSSGDPRANDQLCRLLDGRADGPPYVVALETELRRRVDALFADRRNLERVVRSLRQCAAAQPHFWQLLLARDPRIREIGRELLLPEAARILADETTPASEVRRWLDRLCPVGDVWDKLRMCRRLILCGATRARVLECQRQLQAERPVGCPECGVPVPQDQLEEHLRRAHRIYQFRGSRRSLADTIQALLAAVCTSTCDYEAWESLETLAREAYGPRAEEFLASRLGETLAGVSSDARQEIIRSVAETIAASTSAAQLALALATAPHRSSRFAALVLIGRLTPPFAGALVQATKPLLGRKRAPRALQIDAAASLLRGAGATSAEAGPIVDALIARCGKARALRRLRQLEQQAGQVPAITERCADILRRVRMRCPRCHVQLRHPEMTMHLWTEHALLLDGLRMRRPWRLIRDWIDIYRRGKHPEWLLRCRTLGQRLDPEEGLHRVYRLLLARGVADVEAQQVLLAKARQQRASLCPSCYALVPVPEEMLPRPLNQSHGRLSSSGYCVEVSERGLWPRLTLETPEAVIYRGREPGRWLTRKWATFLLAGPPVLAALAYGFLARYWDAPPEWPVKVGVVLGLLVYLVVRLTWWKRPNLVGRAVDHAWSLLVPRLCTEVPSVERSTFLAGLALTSLEHGRPRFRAEGLCRALHYVENAAVCRVIPHAPLAALKRLEIADLAEAGDDPVLSLVTTISRSFTGELPLTFVQQLLEDWHGNWWTPGTLARLRVLLCDRAFEAGLEVADLLEAGRSAPALGRLLQVENVDGLAQLRLLWSLRPRRSWDRWSDAATVFELAGDREAGTRLLLKYPSLLLADQARPPVYVCCEGIYFKETLFSTPPGRIETRARRDFHRTEYSISLDDRRYPFDEDPTPIAHRLERWFRFYFEDFLPQAAGVHAWSAPPGRKPVQFREAVFCPDCGQMLVAVNGDLGKPVPNSQADNPGKPTAPPDVGLDPDED